MDTSSGRALLDAHKNFFNFIQNSHPYSRDKDFVQALFTLENSLAYYVQSTETKINQLDAKVDHLSQQILAYAPSISVVQGRAPDVKGEPNI